MPHASHRIDVLIVADRPDQLVSIPLLNSILSQWGLDARGKSPGTAQLIEGGCERVWIDKPGRLMLYANQSGGFRVHCSNCGANVATTFGRAHLEWKRGGPRSMRCKSCGLEAPLEKWRMSPHGAFSSWAIVFSGAGGTRLTPAAEAELQGALGAYQLVVRRP